MRPQVWFVSLLAAVSCLHAQSSSFQPSFQVTQFPTGCPSSSASAFAITGDFNGDHIPDLAIGCTTRYQNVFSQISVLLGKGDGTFQPPVVTALNETVVGQFVAVDVNRDGKADLVYGTVTESDQAFQVRMLLSKGDGTFAPPNAIEKGLLPYSVLGAADLNGDGIADLILDDAPGRGFTVMFGKGDGTFATPTLFSASGTSPVAIADFNGDGKPDVITTDYLSFWIWLNKGDGTFKPPALVASANSSAITTLVGDFNGDGKLDLAVNSGGPYAGALIVILGNGDGTFQAPKSSLNLYNTNLFALDLNQDGRTDLAQANGNAGAVIFYLAQPDGTFQILSTVNLPPPTLVADFNGDGEPDMAGWAGSSFDQVSIMINTTAIASTSGAANGASFVAGEPLTAGALASVFGVGFAESNVYASAIPLPTTLGKVSVTIGGFPAPLLFVSAKQINLQVPWEVAGTAADIVVTVNGNALPPFQAHIGPVSPGIFTTQSGTGQAIAINPDGSIASPEHPARVGEALVILATGLGPVTPQAIDGENSSDALRNTVTMPKVTIGGEPAEGLFSGLSPQFVGLNQINVTVPQVKAGVVPLQISIAGITTSNQVTIAVQ